MPYLIFFLRKKYRLSLSRCDIKKCTRKTDLNNGFINFFMERIK